jgi:anti-sigma factor RsiW
MDHNEIRHKLSEYIDGAVTPQERAAIDEHLKTCTTCADALAELWKTLEQVKQIEEVEAPVWMTQKIMANVRAEAEEKKGLFRRLFYPLAVKLPIQAAAVLFLTVTVYYIYSSMHPADKYTGAPMGRLAKQEAPATAQDAAKRKVPEISAEREKRVEQGPGYKSLDMKYEYEKPAPPVPAPPEAGIMTARDESAASAPAKDKHSLENRTMASGAAAPPMMAEQAAPKAGAVQHPEAERKALSDKGQDRSTLSTDREADALLDITEHFAKNDLPENMKVRALRYASRKFEKDLADLRWMQETSAYRSKPCVNRYVVDVDLSGRPSKYLYCYDHSRITLLGVFELNNGTWSEIK